VLTRLNTSFPFLSLLSILVKFSEWRIEDGYMIRQKKVKNISEGLTNFLNLLLKTQKKMEKYCVLV